MERPQSARGFGTLMSTWGEGNSLIQDIYPINERLPIGFDKSSQSEQVMWVDVGGGYGQKTIALKRACPGLSGRFIVQDLPGTIENAPKNKGIENLGHDFFTEQPFKGKKHETPGPFAKLYHWLLLTYVFFQALELTISANACIIGLPASA